MNCHEVRQLLLAYAHGEAAPSEKRLIQAHLFRCPACQSELERTEALEKQLRAHLGTRASRLEAHAGAWNTQQARLAAQGSPALSRPRPRLRLPANPVHWWQAASALVVVMLALFALVPPVRAQLQSQIRETFSGWFHFSTPDGRSQAEIVAFTAFEPYHLTYLPAGFDLSGSGGSSGFDPDFEALMLTYSHEEKFATLVQSSGMAQSLLEGAETLSVGAQPALFVQDFAGSAVQLQARMPAVPTYGELDYSSTHLLVWQLGEVRLELISNLPREEMLRLGESLAPMPAGGLPAPAPARQTGSGPLEFFILLVFGWAGIAAALALSSVSLLRSSRVLALAGVVLALPFSFYLFGTPRGWLLGLLIPACLAVSAWAAGNSRRSRQGWAGLLLAAGISAVVFLLTR